MGIHGGDIIGRNIDMDFSVNLNPLGMPESLRQALTDAVDKCCIYPDISSSFLRRKTALSWDLAEEDVLAGSGASEILMAIVHAIHPAKVLIPVPSFYGYEYVADAAGADKIFHVMKADEYEPDEELIDSISDDVDLIFLANPNNPTGKLIDRVYMTDLLKKCRDKKIRVVLDECFIDFCGEDYSMTDLVREYDNLLVVRAYTKIFAIPGVRLGFLICTDRELNKQIAKQLPEWNVSTFAQTAGVVCADEQEYISKTVEYVKNERGYMSGRLREMGVWVCSGEADYLLIKCDIPLYDLLLTRGILIRDCENYRGLTRGYYRIGIRTREENDRLLKVMGEYLG